MIPREFAILLILSPCLVSCLQVSPSPDDGSSTPDASLSAPTEAQQPPPTIIPSPTLTAPAPTFEPGDAGPILEAGNHNFDAGNFAGAVNDYSLAILANRQYAEAYCRRGLAYLELGDMTQAQLDFEEGLALDTASPICFTGRARILYANGYTAAALQDLEKAQTIAPDLAIIYLTRGRLLASRAASKTEFQQAIRDFDTLILLTPSNVEGYIERGRAYLNSGEPDQALADLNIAQTIDQNNGEIFYLLGRAYAVKRKPQDAINALEQALALGFDNADLYIVLGLAYLSAGRVAEAETTLTTAVDLAPNSPEAHYARGLAYLINKRNYPAMLDANAALRLRADYVEAFVLRGSVYLNLQRWQDALNDFQKAYILNSNYVDALYGIAQAHMGLGQSDEARKALKDYIAKAPLGAANLPQAYLLLSTLDAMLQTPTPTALPTP